jgi:chromosomal replication initiation ATPase DnaA
MILNDPQVKRLLVAVSDVFGVPIETMRKSGRMNDPLVARWACIIILTDKLYFGVVPIGKLFNRHHSTISNSRKKAAELLRTSPTFAEDYRETLVRAGLA